MATVELYKDIGLDPTFKKTIDFTSKSQQRNWFNTKSRVTYDNVNYNKLQNTLKINTNISFDEALSYTYCVIYDIEEESTRRYYCFVQGVNLISVGTIEFQLVLDPIQTFMTEYSLGECMVTRKHCDRWSTATNNITKPYPQPDYTPGEQVVDYYNRITPSEVQFAIICFTSPKLKLLLSSDAVEFKNNVYYAIIPVDVTDPDREFTTGVTVSSEEGTSAETTCRFVTLNELCNGKFGTNSCIPTDGILSISITKYPSFLYSYSGGKIYLLSSTPPTVRITVESAIKINITSFEWMPYNGDYNTMDKDPQPILRIIEPDEYQFYINRTFSLGDVLTPTKPTDGVAASEVYEPALYMEPYTNRYITDGKGSSIMKIPDACTFGRYEAVIKIRNLISSAGLTDIIAYGNMPDEFIGRQASIGAEAEVTCPTIDVVSSAWQNYVLTQRDSDRKMVNDNNWKNAIDNAIFMGYGGSLVASRGASGNDTTAQRQKNILTGVTQAVGMAVGASVVTSVIDAHYAWEAQKAKEQSIKNTPGAIVSSGNGIQSILGNMSEYFLTITRVNGDALSIAYDTFRKYGYLINKYEKPDVKSRKYFDYILTAGCIIEGSLNASIKQELATIYDNGITIFHGDYSSTLDYPTAENIERSLL